MPTGAVISWLVFATVVGVWIVQARRYATWQRSGGQVVDFTYDNSDGNAKMAPVIEYFANGKKRRLQGSLYSGWSRYEPDEQVDILYDPHDEGTAVVDRWAEKYAVFAFVGMISGVIAALVTIVCFA